LAPLSPQVPSQEKRLEVRTAEQVLIAYERNIPVFMARTATGAQFRDGNFETPAGRHMTFAKRPGRHMAAGDIASNGYDLPGVPWICYFTESGIALHGTYWHNDFGKKRSHGCINLTPQAAKWVYRWTMPVVPPTEQEVYETSGTILDII
jgi:lipoprotein-anchoring transpeptidase ErfK/SrfK